MMNMFHALTMPGMTIDHRESISPNIFTTMYVGIRPPPNSIVKNTMPLITTRPFRYFLDRLYAIMAVTIRDSAVPTIVRNSVLP